MFQFFLIHSPVDQFGAKNKTVPLAIATAEEFNSHYILECAKRSVGQLQLFHLLSFSNCKE
ncbi:hypothetical protein CW304_05290 [Bacillus sp. UFRGS-B20]|nr:hypothetical protein CW304_05290 [Bacillus sp. UFRGS-B20]